MQRRLHLLHSLARPLAHHRSYGSSPRLALAQPISLPSLDSNSQVPPAPEPASSHSNSGASLQSPSSRVAAVPTSEIQPESQLVTVTTKTRALVLDAPELGFYDAHFPYVWLRDVCTSPETSIDASSRQKVFKFEDVDPAVKPSTLKIDEQTHQLIIDWDRPLQRRPRKTRERSTYDLQFLRDHAGPESWSRRYRQDEMQEYKSWDVTSLKRSLLTIPSEKMESPAVVQATIASLFRDGITLFKNVPTVSQDPSSCALVPLANKLGSILRTWYGDKVFAVRSAAGSKNIAYTSLSLDLHMDLLHYDTPPRWQMLHCVALPPELTGGTSYFVDAYKAAETLKQTDRKAYDILCSEKVGFEYKNDGHWTYAERPTIELSPDDSNLLVAVNYSPPFQAPLRLHTRSQQGINPEVTDSQAPTGQEQSENDPTDRILRLHSSLAAFSKILQDPKLRFELQMQTGDCVAFDNRRVLHARTAFEVPEKAEGEVRTLLGCYLDETSVKEKFRVLGEQIVPDA